MQKPFSGKRILVAEDEPEIRAVLVEIISEEGAEVVGVENGRAGIEALKHSQFDLVISDVRMPGGDGPALLAEMRRLLPNPPPLIFITAFSDLTPEAAIRAGALGILQKPFGISAFLERVGEILCTFPAERNRHP